ncbi:hypothetical protein R84B8_00323 [Treponema sp. R8-4-B8]
MLSMESVLELQKHSEISQDKTINDYEKTQAEVKLMAELDKGRKAGEIQGWEKIEDVEAALGVQ